MPESNETPERDTSLPLEAKGKKAAPPSGKEPTESKPSRDRAPEGGIAPLSPEALSFLARLGIVPSAVRPSGGGKAPLGLELITLDVGKLKSRLLGLSSYRELVSLLEEGIRAGALLLVAGRLKVVVPGEGGRGIFGGKAFDITDVVRGAADVLKSRDAGPLLDLLVPHRTEAGYGPLGHDLDTLTTLRLVRLRRIAGRLEPVLRKAEGEEGARTLSRIRDMVRPPRKLQGQERPEPGTVFVVRGKPRVFLGGRYLLLEAMTRGARGRLEPDLRGKSEKKEEAQRGGPFVFARMTDLEDIPQPDLLSRLRDLKHVSGARAYRTVVDFAYRLYLGDTSGPVFGSDWKKASELDRLLAREDEEGDRQRIVMGKPSSRKSVLQKGATLLSEQVARDARPFVMVRRPARRSRKGGGWSGRGRKTPVTRRAQRGRATPDGRNRDEIRPVQPPDKSRSGGRGGRERGEDEQKSRRPARDLLSGDLLEELERRLESRFVLDEEELSDRVL